VFGLVTSVIAAFYYLRMVKTMWFDPSPGRTDPEPMDAKVVALGAALFSFPIVLPALALLDPLAKSAAAAFGLS
jgi:NADH-quinone oxidoreductase subunit N